MTLPSLSPAWRTRLARLLLLVTIGTTLATSYDPDWSVQDEESLALPPQIPANGILTQAVVHYQAPRGVWPLWLRVDVPSQPWGAYAVESELIVDTAEVSTTPELPNTFELRCEDRLCEGMLVVELRIRRMSSLDGGVRRRADAGVTLDKLKVSAGVSGDDKHEGFFGCQRKRQQSSTDSPDAPSKLLLDVTLDPFDEALFGGAGAPTPLPATGGTALPALRGLDAGRE